MEHDAAQRFAAEWLAAWNAHDLERVLALALYAEQVDFSSPFLAHLWPDTGGRLHDKAGLRAYWSHALAARPQLRFEPIATLVGAGSVVLHYRGLGGRLCAEFFAFGPDGRIVASHAHEAPAPGGPAPGSATGTADGA